LIPDAKAVLAYTDLIREGDRSDGVYLIVEGLACRYKLRASGARQIMAYLVPGDFCDLDVALLRKMDHSLATLSPCQVVRIDLGTIADLTKHHPSIAHPLRLATLVDEATLREWLFNIGRRSAPERNAHLFCELLLRLEAVKRTSADTYELHIRQEELADTTGLSVVHVNRTIQSMQKEKLIEFGGQRMRILDFQILKEIAEFKSNHLHLGEQRVA
jgi:CRP-like cAMP-binding protein